MKPYDLQNALVQLAKQCNAECTKATTFQIDDSHGCRYSFGY